MAKVKKSSKPIFAGKLATPLAKPPQSPLLAAIDLGLNEHAEERYKAELAHWRSEIGIQLFQKLELLLEHYDIAMDNEAKWLLLAFGLAKDFVPGFAIDQQGRSGAPEKWHVGRLVDLWMDIQELQTARGQTIAGACEILSRRTEWKPFKPETLRKACKRAINPRLFG